MSRRAHSAALRPNVGNVPVSIFREDSPRPPVPGEEDGEVETVGKVTTDAASNHQSLKFADSVAPRRYPPFSADSRVSWSQKYGEECEVDFDDVHAPLGFEPEGSSCKSPPYKESTVYNDSLPTTQGLACLLEDRDGLAIFRQYIQNELGSCAVEFWMACRGVKKMAHEMFGEGEGGEGSGRVEGDKVRDIVKAIYKKYIKVGRLTFDAGVKQAISDAIKKDLISVEIFDDALRHVERVMLVDMYPRFLTSDAFAQYRAMESPMGGGASASSTSSSGCNSVRPTSSLLPTLHEGEELTGEDLQDQRQEGAKTKCVTSRLHTWSSTAQMMSQDTGVVGTSAHSKDWSTGQSDLAVNCGASPYMSYAPVSAQDSELQSLSSDAQTDDTISLTDSSLDGRDHHCAGRSAKYIYRHELKGMRRNAKTNCSTDLFQSVIPRTESLPMDSTLAQKDPEKFAALVVEKLRRVRPDNDRYERLHALLKSPENVMVDDPADCLLSVPNSSTGGVKLTAAPLKLPLNPLLLAMTIDYREDNAQSILERHVRRVFDGSNGQTPTLSPPGQQSPDICSARTTGGKHTMLAAIKHGNTAMSSSSRPSSQQHRGGGDRVSAEPWLIKNNESNVAMGSAIAGVSDMTEQSIRFVHHHNSHGHQGIRDQRSSRSNVDKDLNVSASVGQRAWQACGHDDAEIFQPSRMSASLTDGVGRRVQAVGSRKSSGIVDQPVPYPLHEGANKKVMMWMNVNEKSLPSIGGTSKMAQSADGSDLVSSDRLSNKPNRQRKQYTGVLQPAQPIMTDPSMPLLSLPDTSTQLEEAKRRLEEESRARAMSKSKSFMSGPSTSAAKSDHRSGFAPTSDYRSGVTTHQAVPQRSALHIKQSKTSAFEPSSSEDQSSGSQKSDNNHVTKTRAISMPSTPTTVPPAIPAPDQHCPATLSISSTPITVVVYFFCEEPIPYSTRIHACPVTLLQFKQLVAKKGHFKYYFKKACNEFESGFVYEEVSDDSAVLPLLDGKISAKVSRLL